jgi:cytidine deaminase
MNDILGLFTPLVELPESERKLVNSAMQAASRAYCFQSQFPVGSALLAVNDSGDEKMFHGCNVENVFFPATICAERNAITTAVMEGYKSIRAVAVFCQKYPGGSPCGVCRQMLTQFGRGAVLLNVVDKDGNVRRGMVDELLPAASASPVDASHQTAPERKLVRAALSARSKSHVPYSRNARGAVFSAVGGAGKRRAFAGAVIDNASYGASVGCESAAMTAARLAGFVNEPTLVVTVRDVRGHNPIDGECLQILREFGRDSLILLVGEDQSLVRTTLVELLPDSFGPEAL